jgi:putative ABC transport system permease protein
MIATRTRLGPADTVGEALRSFIARPLLATATSLGALLAVAWFVAMLGLVSTAAGQVTGAFADRLPTAIRVTAQAPRLPDPPFPYPADVARRLRALPGVLGAGVYWPVRLPRPVIVSVRPLPRSDPGPIARPEVIAAAPGFLAAAGVQVSAGRLFDAWDQAHAVPACLVGADLGRSLGISTLTGQPTIYLDDSACAVTGIVSRAVEQPSLVDSVIVSSSTATAFFGPADLGAGAWPAILITTRPGAAGLVARELPYTISPTAPGRITASLRPGPTRLGSLVLGTLRGLFVAAAWLGLAVGALGVAGLTLFCVLQRTPEFALRRALGARRRHISTHVLAEGALLGLLGGLAGASLGLAVVVLVSAANHWTPVIAPATLWPTPLACAAVTIIAGAVPAITTAAIRPAAGLSRLPPL